ncbi:Far upstream element-binding protein 2, partial [Lemmus lemmus]
LPIVLRGRVERGLVPALSRRRRLLLSLKPPRQARPRRSMSDYSTGGPPPGPPPPAGGGGGAAGAGGGPPPGPPGAGDRGGGGPGGGGPGGGGASGGPSQPPGGGGPGIRKDAFADAVQRARQIAAKIGGDAATTVNNNTPDFGFGGQKRQLEDGDQPDSKKLASQGDSIGSQLGPIHPPPRTSMTEEYRVPDGMVGLIIGRGGEQINKIQQDSGCKVQISPDSGGLPERSVSLTGAPESVQKAKMMLDDIVSRGRGGPPGQFHDNANGGQNGTVQEIMIPAGKAGLVIGKGGETIKQLQERAGVKMILIQDGSQNTNVDKPLRIIGDPYKVQQACEMVMDILRERDQGGFGDRNEYGSRVGGGIDVPVPRHSVGVVIGRSGEMIKKIQNDAGVRIQFKQDDGTGPEKIAHIMGPPDRCEHAARIINDLLQSLRSGPPGPPGAPGMPPGGRGRGRGQGNWGPPGGEMTFSIPTHKCGLVIGRGGENVKAINQQTGAFVEISRQLPPNGDPNFKLFVIRGSPQQIDHAKQLIEEKIEGPLCPVGPGPGGPGPAGPMGPFNPGPFNQGPPGQPPGPVPGPAPAPAAPPAQGEPPQPPPTGQSDYTKAWEEYYKKIGKFSAREQWASSPSNLVHPHSRTTPRPGRNTTRSKVSCWAGPGMGLRVGVGSFASRSLSSRPIAQVATGGGPGAPPGSQPDYSAAWAEYYRQQAAYYGQTPGPGGPQPPPTQQGQQQASGNCHPPPPPFSFQPPATVHPALVGSAGNPFPCGVCP